MVLLLMIGQGVPIPDLAQSIRDPGMPAQTQVAMLLLQSVAAEARTDDVRVCADFSLYEEEPFDARSVCIALLPQSSHREGSGTLHSVGNQRCSCSHPR